MKVSSRITRVPRNLTSSSCYNPRKKKTNGRYLELSNVALIIILELSPAVHDNACKGESAAMRVYVNMCDSSRTHDKDCTNVSKECVMSFSNLMSLK